MVEADIHLRLVLTSILDIYVNPRFVANSFLKRGLPDLEFPPYGLLGQFWSRNDAIGCHYIMVEADIHLRLVSHPY
jgi:hypothetical protein